MHNTLYPCLWFDGNALEAATFYCSVFQQSAIIADTPVVVTFESNSQKFMCLNGGPQFKFTPAISFYVVCESQEEIDTTWGQLLAGGMALMPIDAYDWSERYGWVQDKFGVNWQLSLGRLEDVGQKFTPSLLFTGDQHAKAEQAIAFYTSLFPNSETVGILRYGKDDSDVEGTVKHAQFTLNGYVMMAMDSSYMHQFNFTEAVSLVVNCDTQEEIDHYWNKLTEGGEESMCGWLKDKFGVSWQIVPSILPRLMNDPVKGQRVVEAFLKMRKFDIATLHRAFNS